MAFALSSKTVSPRVQGSTGELVKRGSTGSRAETEKRRRAAASFRARRPRTPALAFVSLSPSLVPITPLPPLSRPPRPPVRPGRRRPVSCRTRGGELQGNGLPAGRRAGTRDRDSLYATATRRRRRAAFSPALASHAASLAQPARGGPGRLKRRPMRAKPQSEASPTARARAIRLSPVPILPPPPQTAPRPTGPSSCPSP